MSGSAQGRTDAETPTRLTDDEIAALIAAAVHAPFRTVWPDHENKAWRPIRRTLEQAVAVHAKALAELPQADSGDGDGKAGEQALARYRSRVARDVLKPVHIALRHAPLAALLQRSLDSAADEARAALAGLPALARASVSPRALDPHAGQGAWTAIQRLWARALRPIVWRQEVHDVAVVRIAGEHLDRTVLPRQARAFRASQRSRAVWLGRLERAWSGWIDVVLTTPQREAGQGPEREADAPPPYQDAGATLQAELEALRDDITRVSGRETGDDFRHLTDTMAATVAVAGTFVGGSPSGEPPVADLEAIAGRWDRWASETAARLELYRVLLAAKSGTDAICRRLVDRWSKTAREVGSVLADVESRLGEGLAHAGSLPPDAAGLREALQHERARTGAALSQPAAALQDPGHFDQALTADADKAVEDLEAMSRQLPERLGVHDIPEAGEVIRKPRSEARDVEIREVAVQAFDTLRMERIRTAPSVVARAMERVRSEVTQLCEVSDYGYEAAIGELADGDDHDVSRTLVLVTDALTRAGHKADAARTLLQNALEAAAVRVTNDMEEGVERLIRRGTADRLTAGYLDARSYLVTEVAGDWKRWREGLARQGRVVSAFLGAIAARLRPVATTLGIRPAPAGVTDLSEHTLASAAEFVRTLPVVYQRLFAFEPLTDPQLLAGRDDALAEVTALWKRWRRGGPGSLIVITPPGAGVTSFLNIAATHLSDEAPDGVRRILRERIQEEGQLAAHLASWLGLEAANDLHTLAERVLAAPDGTIPRLVILESAEHLHMRTPGGARLFEHLLTFMSRTESKVFWMVSLTSSGWQLVRRRAPAFVSDIKRLMLAPLTADQLRQAVIARHLRSGLPLQYAQPRAGRDALRNRARRMHRTDKQQQLIEKDYFERLHRASLGSIRLALFHWLRSADFTTVEGSLLVQPLEALSAPMEMLDLTQSFALKAMLDHGTLSADEYRVITRASAAESLHTFGSLQDQQVIVLAGDEGEGAERAPGPGVRYRIRPLMLGAVVAHLRSRNILH